MKILVTGGAGYIGCVLVPLLLRKRYDVTVIDKIMFGGDGLIPCFEYSNFHFIKGDICSEELMKSVLLGKDVIIHLAAYVGYPICKKYPEEAERTNLNGTLLLNRLCGDTPIIFASTGSNYGTIESGICTEETPLNPITLYGVTKTKAEQEIHNGGNSVCFRFATAFGLSPRLRLDLLINDFCYRAKKLKSLIIYESHFKRTFIHIKDIASAFLFAIENYSNMKNEIYNVGGNSMNYTKAEVARKIHEKTDFYLHFAEIDKDEDQRNYLVDYGKIESLGYRLTVDLKRGINELLEAMELIDISNPYSNV